MDASLLSLCRTIKTLFGEIKPIVNPVSYIIMIGKTHQGKTTLLKQTSLQQVSLDCQRPVSIFYNQQGIIVELGEEWFGRSELPLATTIKQLNRCYRAFKITGIILCMDINELINVEPTHFIEHSKAHLQFLKQIAPYLSYRVNLSLFLTKVDGLAGFSEFFQTDHATELAKPLGFSLEGGMVKEQLVRSFKTQFDQLSEMLGQSVIAKIHPARSGLKRTLIREFPLQLASLRPMIQFLVQSIPFKSFNIQSIYFTSAEQGGVSVDRLNKKIQHEYALVVQDAFPQSSNFKAYFVEGAILTFQKHCQQLLTGHQLPNKSILGIAAGICAISFLGIIQHYWHTQNILASTKQELSLFERLKADPNQSALALYHLNKAAFQINQLNPNRVTSPKLNRLLSELKHNAKTHTQVNFLPKLVSQLELVLQSPQSSYQQKYDALKVYLMMGENTPFTKEVITTWFDTFWKQQQLPPQTRQINLSLLQQSIESERPNIALNQSLIQDTRNFLQALPPQYLFLTLARENFPTGNENINIPGFNFSQQQIPIYFTKAGFQLIEKSLPVITKRLQQEGWVLGQNASIPSPQALLTAYSHDYVTWWQQLIIHARPSNFQDYAAGHTLIEQWQQNKSLALLVARIQKETSPNITNPNSVFNLQIANQFTGINLMSSSSVQEITQQMGELNQFLTTLSMVNDEGKTAFNFAKTRFQDANSTDPLSAFYAKTALLPEPISLWAKQIADDTWTLIIKDSRNYINTAWQQTIYDNYEKNIANRYPFTPTATQDVDITAFNQFFAPNGILNQFVESHVKPFIDISSAKWQPKSLNGFQMPISEEVMDELIRANVINTMFFARKGDTTNIKFSLQKISLDPIVGNLQLSLGNQSLSDDQGSESFTEFTWPSAGAKLDLNSIEGNHYELAENGPWAFFKMLQKINVLVDDDDSTSLQILFEINGNTGRYVLKTESPINPFIPGILNGFALDKTIV